MDVNSVDPIIRITSTSKIAEYNIFCTQFKELASVYSILVKLGAKFSIFTGRPGKFYLEYKDRVTFDTACTHINKFPNEFRVAGRDNTLEIQSPHLALIPNVDEIFKLISIDSTNEKKRLWFCNLFNVGLSREPTKDSLGIVEGWDIDRDCCPFLQVGFGYMPGSKLAHYNVSNPITENTLQQTISMLPMPEHIKFDLCRSIEFQSSKVLTIYNFAIETQKVSEIIDEVINFQKYLGMWQILKFQSLKGDHNLLPEIWTVISKLVEPLVLKEFVKKG